jgi:recombination protein RecR
LLYVLEVFMNYFPAALQELADQFARLPGIGGKTAQRLAFHVLGMTQEAAQDFADAILKAKTQVHTCPVCQNLTDRELCPICADDMRDHGVICVVADPKDVIALERSREFRGVYHVLHGVISPLNHVTQDDIKIRELLLRIGTGDVREVIMATNPDTEGESTAMYISRLLRPMEIKVTRLAYGVPVGSQLEYADEVTLSRALEGRQEI